MPRPLTIKDFPTSQLTKMLPMASAVLQTHIQAELAKRYHSKCKTTPCVVISDTELSDEPQAILVREHI
jgi:hypothetical protein